MLAICLSTPEVCLKHYLEPFLNLKLGLIGNAIAKSKAPALHIFLGELPGLDVTYDLFDPLSNTEDGFIIQISDLRDRGYSGCNVTYPFKQIAMQSVEHCEPSAKLVSATNTIKFGSETRAINTDHSGFIRALTSKLAAAEIGSTLILGAGGVGPLHHWVGNSWDTIDRRFLHPTLVAAICVLFVDNFHDPDIYAVILLASSPMASLYPVFGANYGSPNLTASCLTATKLLSLITISGWILILGI